MKHNHYTNGKLLRKQTKKEVKSELLFLNVFTYCKQNIEEDEEAFEASVNFPHLQILVIGSWRWRPGTVCACNRVCVMMCSSVCCDKLRAEWTCVRLNTELWHTEVIHSETQRPETVRIRQTHAAAPKHHCDGVHTARKQISLTVLILKDYFLSLGDSVQHSKFFWLI